MDITTLQGTLWRAQLEQLEQVIDWVRRPWRPRENDALRRLWHEARRHPSTKEQLVQAILREVTRMSAADLEHVARSLGQAKPGATADDVCRLIAARLEPREILAWLAEPVVEIVHAATRLLEVARGAGSMEQRRPGERRRHGRS